MKKQIQLTVLVAVSSFVISHSSFGQGALTPPGAPAPMMKSLAQIEPRTPISSLPFNISTSGSYYLTTNLTGTAGSDGIFFGTGLTGVTVDLNGFALVGLSNSLIGFNAVGACTNIVVMNGTVRNWATGFAMSTAVGCRYERVRILDNRGAGLNTGDYCVVQDCAVTANGAAGLVAGVSCRVADCVVRGNATNGINLGSFSVVERCTVAENQGIGIKCSSSCTVIGCEVSQNTLDGIRVPNRCVIRDNRVEGTGFALGTNACIHAVSDSARIEGNHVVGHQLGIRADNPGNLIVRNTANLNGTNYFIAAGNSVGPTNTSSTTLTNTHPWANFDL